MTTTPLRRLVCCCLAAGALSAPVLAQSPVTLDTSTSSLRGRVTLAGHQGNWLYVPFGGSLRISPPSVPGGSVGLSQLHLQLGTTSFFVPLIGIDQTWVTLTNFSIDAAPTGVALAGQVAPAGTTTFSSSNVPESAQGTANYSATGLACNSLLNGGAPCAGPFNLGLVGSSPSGAVTSGTFTPGTGVSSVSLVYTASRHFVSGTTWGTIDIQATLNGTLGTSEPPSCRADFNRSSTLNVQDIFDFLGAWFAGASGADFDGVGGITVQDIFAFLAAWFTGC